MKSFTTLILLSLAAYAEVSASPARGKKAKTSSAAATAATAATGATTGATAGAAAGGAITRGAITIVMKEVGGIAGNECLTFRNNGEMVDAACVNTAADRQVTPSTSSSGASVLLVQRSFTADFRSDLVGKQACIGFNGTTFLAQDCAGANFQAVSLNANGELVSGTACQSGHDAKAQLTVDATGANCVAVTTTDVTATAP